MTNFFVDPNIASAKTISTDFYNDQAVFDECRQKIFASSFQFIGSTELVRENGDVYPFTILEKYLDEPLLLTRDRLGMLHLLSNVCTHRGNLIAELPCKLSNLRCR